MADTRKLGFGPIASPSGGVLVVFADDNLHFGPRTRALLGSAADLVARAAKSERFAGKSGSALDIVAPEGLKASRLVVLGTGKAADQAQDGAQDKPQDFVKLGGAAMGRVPSAASEVTLLLELADGPLKPDSAADVALGATLRAYSFDRYKTKRREGEEGPVKARITLGVADVAGAKRAWAAREAVADGVVMARDLVNEPPNVLFPIEFARRAASLRKLGVGIDVLDVKAMTKLGMGALLGVGQGSRQDSRIVVMRWNGGKKGTSPIAFIGKGVCFDTGGINLKAHRSMLDMHTDMGGSAVALAVLEALSSLRFPFGVDAWLALAENQIGRMRLVAAAIRQVHLDGYVLDLLHVLADRLDLRVIGLRALDQRARFRR